MNIKEEIIATIQTIVDSAIKKVCPIITFGIVVGIDKKGKCIVEINTIQYEISYYGTQVPSINQKYPVFIPFGNMSLSFIISGNTGGGGGTGGTTNYNELSNRPSINNVILTGNKTAANLSLEPTISSGTTDDYWRGDKTWQTLDKDAVGLSNVDNVKQYSSENEPPYPVTTVNGQTGDVVVTGAEAVYVGDDEPTSDETLLWIDPDANVGVIEIEQGGTGADNAADALENLGAMAVTESSKFGKVNTARTAYSPDAVNLASGTTLTRVATLPVFESGYAYIGGVVVRFASNANGRRALALADDTGTSVGIAYTDVRPAVNGAYSYCQINFVHNGNDKAYQVLAYQNSGSTLSTTVRFYCAKIPRL